MSSDPSGHLSAERLDALAGEGEDGEDRHLAECPECRARLAALVRVRGLLADAAGEEPPLPPGLADRLAAALAAAQAERAAEGPAPRAAGTADVVPLRPRPRVPRWLAAAAGLVVLGGSAVTAAELLGDGPLAGSVRESADGVGRTGAADSGAGGAEGGDGAGVEVTASGTAYTEAALGAQVRTLLSDPDSDLDLGAEAVGPQRIPLDEGSPAQVPRAEQSSPPPQTPQQDAAPGGAGGGTLTTPTLTTPEGLQACLEALGVDGGARVAVDLGTWEGREAAVVVVEDGGEDGAAGAGTWIWVVGPRCGVDGDALLHFQRLAP